MLLHDGNLRRQLSQAGPAVADYYSVRNMTDRVLNLMGLPLRAS